VIKVVTHKRTNMQYNDIITIIQPLLETITVLPLIIKLHFCYFLVMTCGGEYRTILQDNP